MSGLPRTLPALEKEVEGANQDFFRSKHVKYFQMCLNVLPNRVQKEDSSKLALVSFCVTGLDILRRVDILFETESKKLEIKQWIYKHYMGDGFRGSLTHFLGSEGLSVDTYDPANLPATYFGLCILAALEDKSLGKKLDRIQIIEYVKKCQLENGSFSSTLDVEGQPFGDNDLRICLVACSIRAMLRIDELPEEIKAEYDIDTKKLAEYIGKCISYDGGIGGQPNQESHAGFTFCGLAALSLMNKLPGNLDRTVRWLASRQIWFNQYNEGDYQENEYYEKEDLGGFNGRENKYADTCYAFWVAGALKILGKHHLIHIPALEHYLLNLTQNTIVGGFSKTHDDMPDPMHSFLGLAALKLVGSPSVGTLKDIDDRLVITTQANAFLQTINWQSLDS